MTDFPPDLRDCWLKLVEREPKLCPEHLEWHEGYRDPPVGRGWNIASSDYRGSTYFINDSQAAALCGYAMVTRLAEEGTAPQIMFGAGQWRVQIARCDLPGEIMDFHADTLLTALTDATEVVVDERSKRL